MTCREISVVLGNRTCPLGKIRKLEAVYIYIYIHIVWGGKRKRWLKKRKEKGNPAVTRLGPLPPPKECG